MKKLLFRWLFKSEYEKLLYEHKLNSKSISFLIKRVNELEWKVRIFEIYGNLKN